MMFEFLIHIMFIYAVSCHMKYVDRSKHICVYIISQYTPIFLALLKAQSHLFSQLAAADLSR